MEWTNDFFWIYWKASLIFSAIPLNIFDTSCSGFEWVNGSPLSVASLRSWWIGIFPRKFLLNSLAVFSTPPSPKILYSLPSSPLKKLVEFGSDFDEALLGVTYNADLFQEGDFVSISGTSKGKGFQGVVKRHNFRGVGDATHGQHNRLRAPGSIGAASYPARVFKGMRMAGQTGNARVKVDNLQVVKVLVEKNMVVVKGAVPGAKNSYITIEK